MDGLPWGGSPSLRWSVGGSGLRRRGGEVWLTGRDDLARGRSRNRSLLGLERGELGQLLRRELGGQGRRSRGRLEDGHLHRWRNHGLRRRLGGRRGRQREARRRGREGEARGLRG